MVEILLHRAGLHFPLEVELSKPLLYVLLFVAVVLASTVHEFGHAWMADRLGDPTPRAQKRVSLSPLAHLDPLGTLVLLATSLIGFPIGWGRPVRTNPEAYTRCSPRIGMALVALTGPVMNLLCAIALSPIARWILRGGLGAGDMALWTFLAVALLMLVNLSLFCFNLVPVAPLDGSHVLASLLPEPWSNGFRQFMKQFGPYVLVVLMYSGKLGEMLGPVVFHLFLLLIGIRI
jgi:Zn-dependent protease